MIIGIGGVSRSGKSTLANLLVTYFRKNGKKAIILHQDDFVFPETKIPKIKNKTDWESPQSIDFKQYNEVIELFRTRFDIVIAEGLFAFYDYNINQNYDKKFHVKISKRTFLIRRAMDIRWGYEPTWFIDHVWQSFLKYGKPSKVLKGIVNISGEDEFDMEKVIRSLNLVSSQNS
jgi:nicotinamide/nicotinate riboside kinase